MIVSSINWNRTNEIAKPMNHQIGVLRFKTIELILSVTDAERQLRRRPRALSCGSDSSVCGSSAIVLTLFSSSDFKLRLTQTS